MENNKRKVAIYGRVSTEHEAQLSALENQKQYYENLFIFHPEWELYKMYIDEGITGTSTKKRASFLEMMSDAEKHKFDLIVTREVSRFARNTVNTLQETRRLKKIGIEVYFTEDNIWTIKDDDGELRLTIMATLAQNESKKTSQRSKAGQMISFQNAVPYGTGNILGYDRVGKQLVVNEKQAETVKRIFELYLAGNGLGKIKYILEKEGHLTSSGKNIWYSSYIGRVLRNSFYCGIVVYRKEYVPDYLEQKKIKNRGEVEQVVVQGKHEPIISVEDFNKVQKILDSKSVTLANNDRRGLHQSDTIWGKKLRCHCGCTFNKRLWHRSPEGDQFCYQCYSSVRTGTVRTRINKGLSTEGICTSPMVPEWKLDVMAEYIFKFFWKDKKNAIKITEDLLSLYLNESKDFGKEIADVKKKISVINSRYDNLIDLRLNDKISVEIFDNKKKQLFSEKENLEKLLAEYYSSDNITEQDLNDKIKVLKYALQESFDFTKNPVPQEIINAFVKEIVVYEDSFVWKLNFFDEDFTLAVKGRKKEVLVERPTNANGCTGGDCG